MITHLADICSQYKKEKLLQYKHLENLDFEYMCYFDLLCLKLKKSQTNSKHQI